MLQDIEYNKKAKTVAKRIVKLIKSTRSPFVTKKILKQWIEDAILKAYHEGKTDVHREHQRFMIEEALKAFRKNVPNEKERTPKVDRRA